MSYTPVAERAPVYSVPTSSPDVVANTTAYIPTKADYVIFEVLGPTAEMLPSIIIALVITVAIVKMVFKKLVKNQPARAIVATILFSGIYYFMFHSLITASSVFAVIASFVLFVVVFAPILLVAVIVKRVSPHTGSLTASLSKLVHDHRIKDFALFLSLYFVCVMLILIADEGGRGSVSEHVYLYAIAPSVLFTYVWKKIERKFGLYD